MAATLDLWKDVPASVLRKIFVLVPCEADRRSAALVCCRWGAALVQHTDEDPLPLPPQLPWLLLPSPGGPAFSCLLHGDGASGIHRFGIPGDARYFGSYDGRWLFVATRNKIKGGHVLLNLRSGDRYSIPLDFRSEMPFFRTLLQPEASRDIVMLVATLSAAPKEDRCVGAAIVRCAPFDHRSRRQITFWRMGHRHTMAPYDVIAGEPEDVVYYNGDFHFLTAGDSGEHLFVCRLVFSQHGVLEAVNKGLRFVQPHGFGADYEQHPHVRYLVESRGELLMVIKLSPDQKRSEGQSRSWSFMVFRMKRLHTTHPGHMLYTWRMVPALDLDDRILFVGKGCSRSYEMTDFPGFHLHAGVYFLDDYDKSNLDMTVMEHIQFPCSDNGFWSRNPPKIQRCFRPEQDMSAYIPPIWLLP